MSLFSPAASLILCENDFFVAMLEEKPLVLGHCVIFPKRMEDSWTNLTDHELAEMMKLSKKIAKSIEKTIPCKKVGVAMIGLQVKHAHIHLVPIQTADDLNFTRAKLEIDRQTLEQTAIKIRDVL